jgi:hypothetical protein
MIIHNFSVPALLEAHLSLGGHKLSENEVHNLKAMLTQIDSPQPRLWDYEQIVSQHQLWSSSNATYYLGTNGTKYSPGTIDVNRILIIGEADEDSPLALDYRTDNPRILYLGGVGSKLVWIELAASYEEFICALQTKA